MKTYRPLPDCLTIKNSDIEGLGLFATEDIAKGTDLGITHYKTMGNLIRTPLGGFYNHSEEPNCDKYNEYDEDDIPMSLTWIRLVAVKDIKAGEEITVKYTLYKV